MGEGLKMTGKKILKIAKKIAKRVVKILLPVLLIILIILIILGLFVRHLKKTDADYEEGSWKSVPYGAEQYTSNVTIDKDGNIHTSMSAQEIWDKLVENNSRVDEYLDGPEDLLKLMNAEIVTNFPDTRPNPDDPIDWESLNKDVNSKKGQGIIKFKRAKSDGTTETMKFVDEDTFYGWIEEFNITGSEDVKQKLLTHFTIHEQIETTSGSSGTTGGSSGSGSDLNYNAMDIVTDISDRIVAAAKTTPWVGKDLCQKWVRKVYENAGLYSEKEPYASAMDAYKDRLESTDRNNIPVGAAVYGTGTGTKYGHVGIYIVNGLVMDNVGNGIKTQTLDEWIAWQEKYGTGWLGWGWQAGKPTKIISGGTDSSNTDNKNSNNSTEDKVKMQLITDNGKVTFYNGDGSAMEGGKLNALGYELSDGQVAMKELSKYKNSVIYIETADTGEGSYANGKFFYVTDTGGGLANNQVDVYAGVDQATLNAEPYGSFGSGAKIYLVEENVTLEDYQTRYMDKSLGQTENTVQQKRTYQVIVATWNQTTETTTSNEPGFASQSSTTYSATTQTINYQDLVSGYTMPFDYLWALTVMGNDENFPLDLAELVYNSKIEITVHDNLTVTTNTTTENYTKQVREQHGDDTVTVNKTYTKTHTVTTRSNTLHVALTTADVWIVKYTQKFTYQKNGESNTYIPETPEIIEKTDPDSDEDNFVTIFLKREHYDARNSLLSGSEWLFEILEENEKTADVFPDLTRYLFYKATGQKKYKVDIDFEELFDPENFKKVTTGGTAGGLSLTTTMFTKDVFRQALQAYYDKTGNQAFYRNFLSKVDELYDSSIANNINPELVVITAKTEGNFSEAGGSFNYWGVNVPNGSSSGDSYGSLAEGIAGYASYIHKYEYGDFAATIMQRYEERKAAGCDPLGYGLPGTLSGMQSIYSFLGNHVYGSSGTGGYYYMDPDRAGVTKIYATHEEFLTKCKDSGLPEHAAGTVTTVWEQGQYTAWKVEKKLEVWNEIFGAYGSLNSGGNVSGSVTGDVANGTAQEKLNFLFPNGIPTTESEMSKYMTTIDVALTTKNGVKTTGRLTVHKAVVQDVQEVFQAAQDAGFKIYEAAGYSFRRMNNGSGSSLSHHSYGIAIDINVNENYSRDGGTIYAGSFWDPSRSEFSIPKDGVLVNAFKTKGWKWGGDWSGTYQDYMHFSFTGN